MWYKWTITMDVLYQKWSNLLFLREWKSCSILLSKERNHFRIMCTIFCVRNHKLLLALNKTIVGNYFSKNSFKWICICGCSLWIIKWWFMMTYKTWPSFWCFKKYKCKIKLMFSVTLFLTFSFFILQHCYWGSTLFRERRRWSPWCLQG